jgi:hypothetical protein
MMMRSYSALLMIKEENDSIGGSLAPSGCKSDHFYDKGSN